MDLWLLPSQAQVQALGLAGWERLARRADPLTMIEPGLDAALRATFGWSRAPPWAALLAGEAADSITPWLAADLIWLRAEQAGARVMALAADSPQDDPDRLALIEALRPWLADEAIEIAQAQHGRLLLRCPASHGDPGTLAPDALLGLDLREALPADLRWQRRLNELQIVLAQQSLNEGRMQRGERCWNSLWFWGQGSAAECPSLPLAKVASRDPQLCALARHWQRELLEPSQPTPLPVLRDLRHPRDLQQAWDAGLRPHAAWLRCIDGSGSRVRPWQRWKIWR
ncbi:MAG: hypothetical protein IT479_09070 [Xanthomonadales bacterium]|nr:hypothetical protein [Xanthomonadales bacterium]MCC6593414.1 hypothetical protein [Xanthomonadales bacterium]MCE7930576.1 hypothetical protein [Xanthomonadales bacterium PRO6]